MSHTTDEPLVPPNTDHSGPASNGEQVLLGEGRRGGQGDSSPGSDADPQAAERAGAEAAKRAGDRVV